VSTCHQLYTSSSRGMTLPTVQQYFDLPPESVSIAREIFTAASTGVVPLGTAEHIPSNFWVRDTNDLVTPRWNNSYLELLRAVHFFVSEKSFLISIMPQNRSRLGLRHRPRWGSLRCSTIVGWGGRASRSSFFRCSVLDTDNAA